MKKNKKTISKYESFKNQSVNDILYLEFSEIGKYVSNLFFKKLGNREKYELLNSFNKTYAEIKFRYTRYLDNNDYNTILEEAHIVQIERIIDTTYYINGLSFLNLINRFSDTDHSDYYKIKTIHDIYTVFNKINKQHKLINKKHLNLYDIRDLLEEIIITNS